MLSKFFKPKWQHTNPTIRLNAVKSLRDDCDDQYRILSTLAINDPDLSVRHAAIERISVNNLIQLLNNSDTDSEVIETRLVRILSEEQNPEALFEQLKLDTNPVVVWRIICQTPLQNLQNKLLQQIESEPQLLDIAISSSPISIRKIAAERISEPALIEKLFKLTRQNDKAIHRIMRDKCSALREQEKQQQAFLVHAQTVLEQIAHLSKGEWYPLYPAKYEALTQEWNTIQTSVAAAYQQQFDESAALCQERIALVQDKKAADEKELQRVEIARTNATSIIQQLQLYITTIESSTASEQSSDASSALQKQLEHFQAQWALVNPDTTSSQQKTFTLLQQQLSAIHSHGTSVERKLKTVTEFLANSDTASFQKKITQEKLKRANAIIKNIAWPDTAQRPELLQQLDSLIQKLTDEKQQQVKKTADLTEKLNKQLTQLEVAIDNGTIKAADKASRKATEILALLNPNEALDQKLRALHIRLNEMKDWQGFAVTPKKEQLCLDMEELATQETLLHSEKAKLIKQLQQQWKVLDATDPFHSQAIWKRFKTASDKAYEPCEEFFAQQHEARRYNIQQKELIYNEVAAYLQQIEWETCDWRSVEQIIQSARQEWRRFTPVDRNPGQLLQIKFNELLAEAEAHFQEVKESSMTTKEALIAEAASLTTADDAPAAAEQAKNLQKLWKECGPTFHSQERKLWKAFRIHCDVIFQRLQDQTPSREAVQLAKFQLKQITEELLAFEETPLHTEKKLHQVHEARQLIDTFQDTLPSQDVDKFTKAARYIEQQTSALTRLTEHAESKQLLQHAILCDQFEEMILDSKAPTTEACFASWSLNTDNSLHEKIISRRNQIESIASGKTDLDSLLANADKELREICIRLEIALSMPSPERDQALRMEYQMQRLQKALEQQHESVKLTDIKQLEFESLSVPFRQLNEPLNTRFRELLSAVFD